MISAVSKLATCLWFDAQARPAAEFYTSLLPDSEITGTSPGGPDGEPMVVEFTLAGVPYTGLNGGPHFTLNEAVSIQVTLPDQETSDALWDALTADGEESQCGWLKDRYGLSWQVIPAGFVEALSSGTPEQNERATQAMFSMRRLVLADVLAARDA